MTKELTVPCPLCGVDNFRQVYKDNTLTVVQCRECSILYQNPRYSDPVEFEKSKYDSYYRLFKLTSNARRQLFEEKFLLHLGDRPVGKVLDIGCGLGEFLETAEKHGWNATGLEISGWALEYLQKRNALNVIDKTLEAASFPDNEFDAVHCSHILEHISEPLPFLREIRRILKPGGLLLVEVPNEATFKVHNAVMAMIRKSDMPGLFTPHREHVTLFSRKTLERMLERSGMTPVSVKVEGLASASRQKAQVVNNTLGIRVALLLCKMRVDLLLGLGRWIYGVARKEQDADTNSSASSEHS